jgi:hypothetical protein
MAAAVVVAHLKLVPKGLAVRAAAKAATELLQALAGRQLPTLAAAAADRTMGQPPTAVQAAGENLGRLAAETALQGRQIRAAVVAGVIPQLAQRTLGGQAVQVLSSSVMQTATQQPHLQQDHLRSPYLVGIGSINGQDPAASRSKVGYGTLCTHEWGYC